MDFKFAVFKCSTQKQQSLLQILLIQLILASFTLVSVSGCFPYHRGKVETSIVKLEHIDKVRLYSPMSGTGNNLEQGGGAYRQAQSPNVSVIVNFILPNSEQKKSDESSENKANPPIHIDKRTQQKLAETVNNLLYGQRPIKRS